MPNSGIAFIWINAPACQSRRLGKLRVIWDISYTCLLLPISKYNQIFSLFHGYFYKLLGSNIRIRRMRWWYGSRIGRRIRHVQGCYRKNLLFWGHASTRRRRIRRMVRSRQRIEQLLLRGFGLGTGRLASMGWWTGGVSRSTACHRGRVFRISGLEME